MSFAEIENELSKSNSSTSQTENTHIDSLISVLEFLARFFESLDESNYFVDTAADEIDRLCAALSILIKKKMVLIETLQTKRKGILL